MARAKQSAAEGGQFRDGRKHCKRCVSWITRFFVYIVCATCFNLRSVWNWIYEPSPGPKCTNPSRGAEPNKTKVKLLLYGLSKTGTTSTIHFLNDLLERPYHSEDFVYFIWSTLADEYWGRRESGASMWAYHGLATPQYPAYKGHSFWSREVFPVANDPSDRYVQEHVVRTGRLAEVIEQCHVDAMSFDGLELLFWDVFNMSPEAKVLFLNWRTYPEWQASCQQFGLEQLFILLGLNILNVGQHVLPWDVLPLVLGDYLTGNVTKMLRQGLPWARFWDPLVLLFRQSCSERRYIQHWYSGLRWGPSSESQWDTYWEWGKSNISKDRILEVNPKTTKPAEICKFLNITNNPACNSPKIPKVYSACVFEMTHWYSQLALVPWFVFIHWMNWIIFWAFLFGLARTVNRLLLLGGIDVTKIIIAKKAGKKRKAA